MVARIHLKRMKWKLRYMVPFIKCPFQKYFEIDFGAKDPPTRNPLIRFLAFDAKKTEDFYDSYNKENNPTKISCKNVTPRVDYDCSDSNDSNIEGLFNKFF